jgi:hypothetical protein
MTLRCHTLTYLLRRNCWSYVRHWRRWHCTHNKTSPINSSIKQMRFWIIIHQKSICIIKVRDRRNRLVQVGHAVTPRPWQRACSTPCEPTSEFGRRRPVQLQLLHRPVQHLPRPSSCGQRYQHGRPFCRTAAGARAAPATPLRTYRIGHHSQAVQRMQQLRVQTGAVGLQFDCSRVQRCRSARDGCILDSWQQVPLCMRGDRRCCRSRQITYTVQKH